MKKGSAKLKLKLWKLLQIFMKLDIKEKNTCCACTLNGVLCLCDICLPMFANTAKHKDYFLLLFCQNILQADHSAPVLLASWKTQGIS